MIFKSIHPYTSWTILAGVEHGISSNCCKGTLLSALCTSFLRGRGEAALLGLGIHILSLLEIIVRLENTFPSSLAEGLRVC